MHSGNWRVTTLTAHLSKAQTVKWACCQIAIFFEAQLNEITVRAKSNFEVVRQAHGFIACRTLEQE